MKKLWAIAYKDIRTRFTDRTLLVIMIAAPLAISTIIGLAFGGLGRTESPIQDIPVAVINNDQSSANGESFGAILSGLLTTGQLPAGESASLAACPHAANATDTDSSGTSLTLGELITGTSFDDNVVQGFVEAKKIEAPAAPTGSEAYLEQAARAAVDKGIYTALVIIPADFSQALASLADPRQPATSTTVTVYGNAGKGLSAGIVRSVVDSIVSQLTSGNIALGVTRSVIGDEQPQLLVNSSNHDFSKLFVCAFATANNPIQLVENPVQAVQTNTAGTLLVTFGSAQALFFALFTGQFGILSMYEERKDGTLQRILVSPTPRWNILGGKLVGVLVSVMFQLLILIFAMTIVGSIIEGRLVFIWGNDIGMLALLLIGSAIEASGLGMFLAGVLKGIEQANIVGSVLNIALGVLGGGFGFQLPKSVAQFSFIYWARSAFDTLAAGRGDISMNLLVLFVEGALLFLIGLLLFNRKFEV
jgi:ABC-2 type transport system permease protein